MCDHRDMDEIAVFLPAEEAPNWRTISGWAPCTGIPNARGEEQPTAPTFDRLFVARDEDGRTASVLLVRIDLILLAPEKLIVITRPDARRRGLASALFAAAAAAGIPTEELSGAHGLTAEGAAFQVSRRAALARSVLSAKPARRGLFESLRRRRGR